MIANATDADSGVKSITKPDGTVTIGATATYVVTTNGNYPFTLTDNVGNTTQYVIPVTNVDKGNSIPTNYSLSKATWTCGNVTITFTRTDTGSGIKSITAPNGTVTAG
jgi:hypothetical protein